MSPTQCAQLLHEVHPTARLLDIKRLVRLAVELHPLGETILKNREVRLGQLPQGHYNGLGSQSLEHLKVLEDATFMTPTTSPYVHVPPEMACTT